jgi:hypothetical protein
VSDTATLILLITHPSIDPEFISERLGFEPSLANMAGNPVITPSGSRTGSFYKVSKWQYKEHCDASDDWKEQLRSLVGILQQNAALLRTIDAEGGKNLIYFVATDFPHAALEVDSRLLAQMAELKIAFGFEFFMNPEN